MQALLTALKRNSLGIDAMTKKSLNANMDFRDTRIEYWAIMSRMHQFTVVVDNKAL